MKMKMRKRSGMSFILIVGIFLVLSMISTFIVRANQNNMYQVSSTGLKTKAQYLNKEAKSAAIAALYSGSEPYTDESGNFICGDRAIDGDNLGRQTVASKIKKIGPSGSTDMRVVNEWTKDDPLKEDYWHYDEDGAVIGKSEITLYAAEGDYVYETNTKEWIVVEVTTYINDARLGNYLNTDEGKDQRKEDIDPKSGQRCYWTWSYSGNVVILLEQPDYVKYYDFFELG